MKARHCRGPLRPGDIAEVHEYGGHGSAMLRRKAMQDGSAANTTGYLTDGTKIRVEQAWVECLWNQSRGFIKSHNVSDYDVVLTGTKDQCKAAVAELKAILGFNLHTRLHNESKS